MAYNLIELLINFMIRPFKKEDAERCSEIMNKCQMTMTEFSKAQAANLVKRYNSKFLEQEFSKEFVLVFEENNKILGLGGLLNINEIRGLYIDPEYHGKGCGTTLLHALEKEAKKRKLPKIVIKSYFGAVSFYLKHGYKKLEEGFVKRGKFTFRYLNMEKTL